MKIENRREAFITGLRELADFFEKHPSIKTPFDGISLSIFPNLDELKAMAKLTSWDKKYLGGFFQLVKKFGDGALLFEAYIGREEVCCKVVTGTRIIAAQPAKEAEPEHEEEIVEWICDESSLLAK